METIVGLIPTDESVVVVRQELEKAGFSKNKISILSRPFDVWQRLEGRQKIRVVSKEALIGMVVGLVVGAIYGVPAGICNCEFMDYPVETSVILGLIISLFWVAVGGFVGAVAGVNRFEDEFYSYIQGVKRGDGLFAVEVSEEEAPLVRRILQQQNGILIRDIREEMGSR